MICKNCSMEYDDSLEACPGCEAENEKPGIQSEPEAAGDSASDESLINDAEERSENTETAELSAQAEDGASEEKQGEPEKTEIKVQPEEVKMKAVQSKKVSTKKLKAKKAHRNASAFIIVIMSLVAVLAVALTVISVTTDTFKSDDTSEKVVAGVGLTAQDEKELETLLAKSFSVSRNEYNKLGTSAEDFLANIKPWDSGNVYSRLNGVTEPVQTSADPAGRFADENGTYAYYKLEQSRVDKVLELFALKSYRGENCEKYYYCDGFYYFDAEDTKTTPEVSVKIVKSRRVLDGSYYVEGYFYIEKQGETVKTDNCHFVVEIAKNEQSGEKVFVLDKVSKEPIFGSDGKLVDQDKTVEKKTEVIEGFTDDGKLVCVYNLEYPVVEGKAQAYKNVNDFFKNAVSVYELKAKAAQQTWNDFKKNGGNEGKLPIVENVIADIVFEDDKSISFVSQISRYNPTAKASAQSDSGEGVYKRSVEAYTFDKASGDFVAKDDVLGKDYLLVSEVLYRIYNGYEYESVLPKENEEEEAKKVYDEVPADRDGIGTKIYESSWSYTEKGVTFYYLTEKGYVTEVTIPFDTVKKIK